MIINNTIIFGIISVSGFFCLFIMLRKNKPLILTPELTSYSMHFKNAKSVLSEKEWNGITKIIFQQSNNECDICHSTNKIECHEKWVIDDANSIQRLVGFNTLCCDCHQVKHIGLTQKDGLYKKNILHMANTNHISTNKAERFVKYYKIAINKRNKDYSLDLSYLNKFSDLTKRTYTKYENRSCVDMKNNW